MAADEVSRGRLSEHDANAAQATTAITTTRVFCNSIPVLRQGNTKPLGVTRMYRGVE